MDEVRVLCVGVNPAFDVTLTLDGLDDDRVNRVTHESRLAAGKAANVAAVLNGMDVETCLTGFFGRDTFDEWKTLFSCRADERILVPLLTQGSTRQNITLLADGRTVKVNRAGDPVAAQDVQRLAEMIRSWLKRGDIAVFTGSIPRGMSREQYWELIRCASDMEARVVIDSDIITRDELLSLRPWLYKPNAHELAALCGADAGDEQKLTAQAKLLADGGVENILLTLGSRGLVLISRSETVRVPAGKVEAINTVGAGDAALAAYIAAYIRGDSTDICARKAAIAGEKAVAVKC